MLLLLLSIDGGGEGTVPVEPEPERAEDEDNGYQEDERHIRDRTTWNPDTETDTRQAGGEGERCCRGTS